MRLLAHRISLGLSGLGICCCLIPRILLACRRRARSQGPTFWPVSSPSLQRMGAPAQPVERGGRGTAVGQPIGATPSPPKAVQRAEQAVKLAHLGELSSGCQALAAEVLVPAMDETLPVLRDPSRRPQQPRGPLDSMPASPLHSIVMPWLRFPMSSALVRLQPPSVMLHFAPPSP